MNINPTVGLIIRLLNGRILFYQKENILKRIVVLKLNQRIWLKLCFNLQGIPNQKL